MSISDVKSNLAVILQKRVNFDFTNCMEIRDEKLLGEKIRMPARELVLVLYDIEREMNVKIPDRYIKDGYFDTFNHIADILKEQL